MENLQSTEQDFILQSMIESRDCFFLTGKAGTGKSTLLQKFVDEADNKKIIKLAPTGVAALNIGGMTIHRFFGFPIDVTEKKIRERDLYMKPEHMKLLAAATTIVIDEISMVRADLFDMIDLMIREVLVSDEPFGGKQMILVGDLFQLPPVVTDREREHFSQVYRSEFFFDARVFEQIHCHVHELQTVYRQHDEEFLKMLSLVRIGRHDGEVVERINKAVIDSFDELPQGTIMLTTTKRRAAMLNTHMLNELGEDLITSEAKIKGKFPNGMLPNDAELTFKKGAQIMMIKNEPGGLRHNGSIGTIVDMTTDKNGNECVCINVHGHDVQVSKEPWDVFEPTFNAETQSIDYKVIGTFTQYPFQLGWAVTIHKSQGLTFDHVCVDFGMGAFAQGQVYVALSRATSFEGLFLNRALSGDDILTDERVVAFMGNALVEVVQETVEDAIIQKKAVQFVYRHQDETEVWRVCKPEAIEGYEHNGTTYPVVRGYCYRENKERLFDCAKMVDVEVIEECIVES